MAFSFRFFPFALPFSDNIEEMFLLRFSISYVCKNPGFLVYGKAKQKTLKALSFKGFVW